MLDLHWTGTTYYHTGEDSSFEEDWDYRVTAYDHSGNASQPGSTITGTSKRKAGLTYLADSVVGDGTPGTLSQITENAAEIDLRVESGDVINAINLSTEGIRIDASKLTVSGYTEFASGYNPSTKAEESYVDSSVAAKLDHTGGQIGSGGIETATGTVARVKVFPDADTGILALDNAGSEVFRVNVGGDDVGDVVIGDPDGQYAKWDKSLETFAIVGTLQTSTGQQRITIGGDAISSYFGDEKLLGIEYGCLYKYGGASLGVVASIGTRSTMLTDWGGAFFAEQDGGGAQAEYSYSDIRMGTNIGGSYQSLKVYIGQNGTKGCIELNGTGAYVDVATEYKVNGTRVVGAQQSVVGNITQTGTDQDGDCREKVNAILTALRAHGLIAT